MMSQSRSLVFLQHQQVLPTEPSSTFTLSGEVNREGKEVGVSLEFPGVLLAASQRTPELFPMGEPSDPPEDPSIIELCTLPIVMQRQPVYWDIFHNVFLRVVLRVHRIP